MNNGDKKTILIVEDDQKIRLALTARLKSEGYCVLTAEDAVQAMSVAVKSQPDLVLLDISMPGGDGMAVAERMLAVDRAASIPVIFMTASKKPDLCERAIELGARGFFEKPLNTELLLQAIERCVNEPVA